MIKEIIDKLCFGSEEITTEMVNLGLVLQKMRQEKSRKFLLFMSNEKSHLMLSHEICSSYETFLSYYVDKFFQICFDSLGVFESNTSNFESVLHFELYLGMEGKGFEIVIPVFSCNTWALSSDVLKKNNVFKHNFHPTLTQFFWGEGGRGKVENHNFSFSSALKILNSFYILIFLMEGERGKIGIEIAVFRGWTWTMRFLKVLISIIYTLHILTFFWVEEGEGVELKTGTVVSM